MGRGVDDRNQKLRWIAVGDYRSHLDSHALIIARRPGTDSLHD